MRYDSRAIITSGKDKIPTLKKRDRRSARHYDTAKFNYLDEEDRSTLTSDVYTWKTGDQYFKLSLQYYGNTSDWYVIALHNNKPTDFHVKEGDEILIPFPLHLAKELYGVS